MLYYPSTLNIALGAENTVKTEDSANGSLVPSLGNHSCESQMIS